MMFVRKVFCFICFEQGDSFEETSMIVSINLLSLSCYKKADCTEKLPIFLQKIS